MPALRRLGVRCDVGQHVGVGHLMRCAALAEEFARRGWTVEFAAQTATVPLAADRLAGAGFTTAEVPETPADHAAWVSSSNLDAVVLDSYLLKREVSEALLDAVPLLTIIDGSTHGQTASLYVDQNFGAERRAWPSASAVQRLAGVRYALISDAFISRRPTGAVTGSDPLRILIALGGTDAAGLTGAIVAAVGAAGVPVQATVVTNDPGLSQHSPDPAGGIAFTFITPTPRLAELLADSHAVIGAAGSTMWEASCLGLPTAAIAVADNQRETYSAVVNAEMIFGLGDTSERIGSSELTARIGTFLRDAHLRKSLADNAYAMIDGGGKARVYNAFEGIVS